MRQNKISKSDWPVSGGEAQNSSEEPASGEKDILITGHEDGSVKFWGCAGVALTCLVTVKTKPYFVGDDLDEPCGESGLQNNTYSTSTIFKLQRKWIFELYILIFRRR